MELTGKKKKNRTTLQIYKIDVSNMIMFSVVLKKKKNKTALQNTGGNLNKKELQCRIHFSCTPEEIQMHIQ